MNNKLTLLFTKRKYNPVSWLIRWCLPRSRFYIASSSHCLIKDGEFIIEASMTHGVRRVPYDEGMKGLLLVNQVEFNVPDEEAGLAWARTQVGLPYDFKGALGLALAVDRDWMEADSWFCFELAAAAIMAAGRDCFRSTGHIIESHLMALKP